MGENLLLKKSMKTSVASVWWPDQFVRGNYEAIKSEKYEPVIFNLDEEHLGRGFLSTKKQKLRYIVHFVVS